MSSYTDAFEVPVTLNIDGKDVVVNHLTSRDYLGWVGELADAKKATDKALIPREMKPELRYRVLRNIDDIEFTPADIGRRIEAIPVKLRIVEMALVKAGITKEAAVKWIDSNTDNRITELAIRMSGLYKSRRDDDFELEKGETDADGGTPTFANPLDGGAPAAPTGNSGGNDPNDGAAASPSAANSTSTGTSTESSLSDTSKATP